MDELERSARLMAWMDTLDQKERARADFVLSLEGGTQADAHLSLLIMKLEERSIWKDGAKAVGALVGMAAAAVAGAHGVPRP